MSISIDQLIGWVIVGALVGTVVGRLVHHRKRGYGFLNNLLLGMAGAIVGGILFDVFDISLGLTNIAITTEDLVAAFFGSFVVLGVVWLIRRR